MKTGYYWFKHKGSSLMDSNWEPCRVESMKEWKTPVDGYSITFLGDDGGDFVMEKDLSEYAEFKGPIKIPD